MVVGLPGTGISGLMYILLSLAMPVREVGLIVTGHPTSWLRWRGIGIHMFNAVGITASLWAVGAGLTRLAVWVMTHDGVSADAAHAAQVLPKNLVSGPGAHLAMITLLAIVILVEVIALIVAPRRRKTVKSKAVAAA